MIDKIACVIPCPSDPPFGWDTFQELYGKVAIIAVRDNNAALHPPPEVLVADPHLGRPLGYTQELANACFQSAACRNYGHYLAYKHGYEYIISLDYDCQPHKNFIEEHLEALTEEKHHTRTSLSGWINTINNPPGHVGGYSYARGFPYEHREVSANMFVDFPNNAHVAVNMGLWDNILDLNGIDRLETSFRSSDPASETWHTTVSQSVIPLCGMNVCFKAELVPAYFFLPNFTVNGWLTSRHDDIWGGYILQKLMQKYEKITYELEDGSKGMKPVGKEAHALSFGHPIVTHQKLTDPVKSAVLEHYMHLCAPHFYELVDRTMARFVKPTDSYSELYTMFAEGLSEMLSLPLSIPSPYLQAFKDLSVSMSAWAKLYQ